MTDTAATVDLVEAPSTPLNNAERQRRYRERHTELESLQTILSNWKRRP